MKRMLLAIILFNLAAPAIPQEAPARPRILAIARVEFYSSDLRATNKFFNPVFNLMQPTNCVGGCDHLAPARAFSPNNWQVIGLDSRRKPEGANRLEEITFATDDITAMRRYLEFRKFPLPLPRTWMP